MPEVKPICSSSPFIMMQEYASDGMAAGKIKEMDTVVAVSLLFGGAIRMINLKLDGVTDTGLASFAEDLWSGAYQGIRK